MLSASAFWRCGSMRTIILVRPKLGMLENNFSQSWAASTTNQTLDFLATYTHTYGDTHLYSSTYSLEDRFHHTTKLSSDFAGTFATAVLPRLIEA